jgi:hypothetical protein
MTSLYLGLYISTVRSGGYISLYARAVDIVYLGVSLLTGKTKI